MKFIISVVNSASVKIPKKDLLRKINKGLLIYVGISKEDVSLSCDYDKIVSKLINGKFIVDETLEKINLSVKDINGEILLISNFTLYGRNKKGNKLDFTLSANFSDSLKIYNKLVEKLSQQIKLKTGEFGEYMIVESQNTGPLNYILEF